MNNSQYKVFIIQIGHPSVKISKIKLFSSTLHVFIDLILTTIPRNWLALSFHVQENWGTERLTKLGFKDMQSGTREAKQFN